MNQLPVYMTSTTAGGSPRLLETLSTAESGGPSAFQPISFNNQQSSSYGGYNSNFHTSANTAFTERKADYLSVVPSMLVSCPSVIDTIAGPSSAPSTVQSLLPVRLPQLTAPSTVSSTAPSVVSRSITQSVAGEGLREEEHLNSFMDSYFDHGSSQSGEGGPSHQEEMEMDMHLDDNGSMYDDATVRRMECVSKRKEQREREMEQLDQILRSSNDITDDACVAEKMKGERARARRAEAARMRYQRMSEEERRVYNHRRRMRQLGLDPDMLDPSKVPEEAQQQIRDQVRRAYAKKAEMARLRYHRMTEEEKRAYNQRRTEAFRKRRMEEEMLLSTPAGRISADALHKAQQIMIRNAKKADSARARYQRLSPDERKAYNARRAHAKKMRDQMHKDGRMSNACSLGDDEMMSPDMSMSSQMGESDVIVKMEKDVAKRTRTAQQQLMRQQAQQQHQHSAVYYDELQEVQPGELDAQLVDGGAGMMLVSGDAVHDDKHLYTMQSSQLIDEKALHEMLLSGRDAEGRPVQIRNIDGTPFQPHLQPGGGVVVEHVIHDINKPTPLYLSQSEVMSSGSSSAPGGAVYTTHHGNVRFEGDMAGTSLRDAREDSRESDILAAATAAADMTVQQRIAQQKMRRAEKSRQRYHSMSNEERQQFNAKRAEALRKSRRKDEELIQLAESVNPEELPDQKKVEIEEAQRRRSRRAEMARAKYHRMNSEERRQYNAMRDAQRRQRKREQESRSKGGGGGVREREEKAMSGVERGDEQVLYSGYDMPFQDGIGRWEEQ